MRRAGKSQQRGWEKISLPLLAAGSIASGLLTFLGGLGMMMILNDLLQSGDSNKWGWSLLVAYASQIVAILLGWIAFALDRPRLASILAVWPILLGLIIVIGLTLSGSRA